MIGVGGAWLAKSQHGFSEGIQKEKKNSFAYPWELKRIRAKES